MFFCKWEVEGYTLGRLQVSAVVEGCSSARLQVSAVVEGCSSLLRRELSEAGYFGLREGRVRASHALPAAN